MTLEFCQNLTKVADGKHMKRIYRQILKETLHEEIVKTRVELGWTQEQMAERMEMDVRSYSDLDHGKCSCGVLTLILFLIYCCTDSKALLVKIRSRFDEARDNAA